jgi:tetratricopeptide (TPR) repeat protein
MESPKRNTRQRLAALLLAGAIALAASGEKDPFRRYLEEHPGVAEDELIEVAAGDPLDRALAVIHHPDLGVDPLCVDLLRIEGAGAVPLDPGEIVGNRTPTGDLFIAVRQRCASDHAVMRRIGQAVFRPLRRGSFRYGPLAYQEWDDAFAAPTPVAMISRLETSAAARPGDAHAQNRLGVGLFAVGERDAAVEALRRAAELEPGWSLPHRNLAAAHLHRGDLAAAAHEHERADQIDRTAVGAGPPGPR